MLKKQLQNIVRLIELNDDYNNIQDSFQLQERKKFSKELADVNPDLQAVQKKFQDFMIKRKEAWMVPPEAKAQTPKFDEEFQLIVMGSTIEDLRAWSETVVQIKATEYKDQAIAKRNQQTISEQMSSFFLGYLERHRETDQPQEQADDDSDEFFDAVSDFETPGNISPLQPIMRKTSSLTSPSKQPLFEGDFHLGEFILTLYNNSNDKNGLKVFLSGFRIKFLKFDDEKSDHPYSYEVTSTSQNFGIISLEKEFETNPIIERIDQSEESKEQQSQWMSELRLTKRNVLFECSNQVEVDFEINATMKPVRYVHRPDSMDKLFDIVNLESMKDELKQKAQAKLDELKVRMNETTKKALIDSNKKNLIKVEVLCPLIELPFSNNKKIYCKDNKEKWVIELGNLLFKNFDIQTPQDQQYKSFMLQLTDGFFKYHHPEEDAFDLINDLSLALQININKETKLAQQPLWSCLSQLSEVNISLTPYLYNNIINIKDVIFAPKNDQALRFQQNLDKLKSQASKQGYMKRQGQSIKYWKPVLVILNADKLWLFNEEKLTEEAPESFQISGLTFKTGADEGVMEILNDKKGSLVLQFESVELLQEWRSCIESQSKMFDSGQKPTFEQEEPDEGRVTSVFNFEVPKICFNFRAEKGQLRPELDVLDPYDCGIFSLEDQQIEEFNLLLELSDLKFVRTTTQCSQSVQMNLSSINLKEQLSERQTVVKSTARYPFIIRSHQGLSIEVKQVERQSQTYQHVDMLVGVNVGKMECNWKPRTLNRILRFIRYNKFKAQVIEAQMKHLQFLSNQLNLLNQTVSVSEVHKQQDQQHFIMDCETHPQSLIKVEARFEQLGFVCIHPNNDTYPIFTVILDQTAVNYSAMFDHDVIDMKMGNLQVKDNTNYPRTLDPTLRYDSKSKLESFEILSRRQNDDHSKDSMMEMRVLLFHNPLQRACPMSRKEEFKCFDKHVKINLKTMRINFLMEYLFRLQDYLLYQFIGATSDSNPYCGVVARAQEEFQTQQSPQHQPAKQPEVLQGDIESHFLSTQNKFTTGLEINLSHPLITLQDRFYLKKGIRIDFGEIKISNSTGLQRQRWKHDSSKEVMTNTIKITGNGLTMIYQCPNKIADHIFTMLQPTNFVIKVQRINESPLLQKQYMSEGFDFSDLDISQHVKVQLSPVKLNFTQEVYTYLLRCSDLNINFSDQLMKHFQLAIWNDPDSQKYIKLEVETQSKYSGKLDVFRQKINVKIPSLSLSLLDQEENNTLIAELVFWNFSFSCDKLLDSRKEITLKCHSLQVLKQNQTSQSKADKQKVLIMGHISALNNLVTDDHYYNFTIDHIINSQKITQPNQLRERRSFMLQHNFELHATLMTDGEKIVKCKFKQPKIFMRSNIFLKILEFFSTAYPKYETEDKPNFYSGDAGNASRQEMIIEMNEALICFENDEESLYTLAFQGSLIVTKAREKLNQVKSTLLNRYQSQDEQFQIMSDSDFDHSAKTTIMLVSLTDFSTYFCQTSDLDGKPFRKVKKRELTSPFNMHYNVHELIELKHKDSQRSQLLQGLEFRTFKNTEASIDWTLFKITFKDFQSLQKIADYNIEMLNNTLTEQAKRRDQNECSASDEEEKSQWPIKKSSLIQTDFESSSSSSDCGNFDQRNKMWRDRQSFKSVARLNVQTNQNAIKDFIVQRRPSLIDTYFKFSKAKEMLSSTITPSGRRNAGLFPTDFSNLTLHLEKKFLQHDTIQEQDEQSPPDEDLSEFSTTRKNIAIPESQVQTGFARQLVFISDQELGKYSSSDLVNLISSKVGQDTMQVVSYGLKVLVINDNKGNFLPVFGISLSEFFYSVGLKEGDQNGKTSFNSMISYYNALAGSWEPAVENFGLQLGYQILKDQQKQFTVLMDKELNINMSESLLKTLKHTLQSIKETEEQEQEHHAFKRRRSGKTDSLSIPVLINFQDGQDQSNDDRSEEIIVTPYAICNMTESDIIIEKQVTEEAYQKQQSLQLKKSNTNMFSRPAQIVQSRDIRASEPLVKQKIIAAEHFVEVLTVAPCSTSDYAVDYDKQLKQQIDHYQYNNTKKEEMIQISFGRGRKAPIQAINLNNLGQTNKHQFSGSKNDKSKLKEFITYGVTFQNLKRVLTLRTQFLIQNSTAFDYSIKIQNKFEPSGTETRILHSGRAMPLPEQINQSVLFLKLFQDPESSWSQELPVYALKKVIKTNSPGYLRHGLTYTFFRKVESEVKDTYNIVLMPPLVLKNFLPQPLQIQFVDSNNQLVKMELQKEEVKNIFQFDLQKNIKLQIGMDGYNPTTLTLDTSQEAIEDKWIKLKIRDFRSESVLEIHVTKSSKNAGFQITFFIPNCVINETEYNLNFFYQEPSRSSEYSNIDMNKLVSVPFQFKNSGVVEKVHMLNLTKQVWAKMEGSPDVSQPIHTFAPGTIDKFKLYQKNLLYEFGYSTKVFLASKQDFIYTKITTISHLFVVVNCTKTDLLFAQTSTKNSPMQLKPQQSQPFNWNDKDGDLLACIRIIPNGTPDYDWSVGFNLQDIGSLIVQNRQLANGLRKPKLQLMKPTGKTNFGDFMAQLFKQQAEPLRPLCKTNKRFFKISRKYKDHQLFIVIEEEDAGLPAMLVENQCTDLSIVFQQQGNTNQAEIDIVDPNQDQAFSWSNHYGQKQLQIEFYAGPYSARAQQLKTVFENQVRSFIAVSIDELNNPKRKVVFADSNQQSIQLTVTTNGYTKILRFESSDRKNSSASLVPQNQATKKYDIVLSQINLSIISKSTELLTIYLKEIKVKIEQSKDQLKCEFAIQSFQIDNQSERDPIYPVMLKVREPIRLDTVETQVFEQQVFQLHFDMQLNVYNVLYINLFEFLLQGLELRLEISHLVLLTEFFARAGKMFKQGITKQHHIFFADSEDSILKEESKLDDSPALNQTIVALQRKSVMIQKKKENFNTIIKKFKHPEVPSGIERIYIKEYRGSPLALSISLLKHGKFSEETGDQLSFLKTVSSLGLTITSFENAPITLNALEIHNVFGDKDEVQEQLKEYYIQMVKWNALSFLGASNLIGNPIGFINTLGTGVKDFYYEPVNGFMKGAKEGGLGIVKGTGSLFKNTFLGSVNSIGKISSSLSATVLSITGDEEFIQKRQLIMVRQKPRGFMQGINQGVEGAFQSGWSGLQGVIDKPNEGYKRDGAAGFFKGALKGAAGLFVKPISGAMDILAKTSEGIHNSNKTQAELQMDERYRQPRAFYGVEMVIQEYDPSHANLLYIVPKLKLPIKEPGEKPSSIDLSIFYNAWVIESENDVYDWHVLMLTKSQITRVAKFKNLKSLMAKWRKMPYLQQQGKGLTQIISVFKISEVTVFEKLDGYVAQLVLKDGHDTFEILEISDKRLAKLIFQKIQAVQAELQQQMIQTAI